MRIDNVLLGLIRMHPRISGYQLKAVINDSTGFFFSAHNSQIYPALRRLHQKGWATYEVVSQDGKPNLKLYTLTDAGIEALEAWLTESFDFQRSRDAMDYYFLKLIFMGHLDRQQILDYVEFGIERISHFKEVMTEENLEREKEFIEDVEGEPYEAYLKIWSGELGFILDDLQRKIERLEQFRMTL